MNAYKVLPHLPGLLLPHPHPQIYMSQPCGLRLPKGEGDFKGWWEDQVYSHVLAAWLAAVAAPPPGWSPSIGGANLESDRWHIDTPTPILD